MSDLVGHRAILRRANRKLAWLRAAGQVRTEPDEKRALARIIRRFGRRDG